MRRDRTPSSGGSSDRAAEPVGRGRFGAIASVLDRAAVLVAAVVVATTAAVVIAWGLRLHPLSWLFLWGGWAALVVWLNRRAISSMRTQRLRRPRVPGSRLLWTAGLGLVVAAPFTLLVLGPQIEAIAVEARPAGPGSAPAPTREEAGLQATAELDIPQVEDDQEVVRLRNLVTARQDQLLAADKLVVCERDGTCGSEREGEGPNYATKVDARNRVQDQLTAVEAELATAREAASARVADRGRERDAANKRLTTLRTSRVAAATAVAPGASLEQRCAAVWAVGDRSPLPTGLVPFVGVGLYALMDMSTLAAVVRRRTPLVPRFLPLYPPSPGEAGDGAGGDEPEGPPDGDWRNGYMGDGTNG